MAVIGLLILASGPASSVPIVASGSASPASVVIDFDDLEADGFIGNDPGIYPANQYVGSGVTFRTGTIDGAVAVGNVITLNDLVDEFELLGGPGQPAISKPNIVIPRGGGPASDLLMVFTAPVTSVSVTSDNYVLDPGPPPFPESAEVIRLLALGATADPNQFTVLAVDEKLDDAVSPPDNLLSVNLGDTPFPFALLEITTEQEGFDDLTFVPTIEVALDINPRSCPNPINARSRGVLPVAVLGTARLDVYNVDPWSLLLEGVTPLRSRIEDVSTPAVNGECTTAGRDGFPDLTLKFETEDIVAALGPLTDGETRTVTLTGTLLDGTPIFGEDHVVIRIPGNGGRALSGPGALAETAPVANRLSSAAPNPFSTVTTIGFSIDRAGVVQLSIYDAAGRLVARPLDQVLGPGQHAVTWSGRSLTGEDLAAGVYFYRLETDSGPAEVRRIALTR
jgi:hypothetical protein